jgi:hypothetical protein
MLDRVGHIISTADIVADDLEAAKHHAFSILAATRREPWTAVYGVEIWSGEVKVFPTSTLGRKA